MELAAYLTISGFLFGCTDVSRETLLIVAMASCNYRYENTDYELGN